MHVCVCAMLSPQVCNHPDLFEGRPIISAFDAPTVEVQVRTAHTHCHTHVCHYVTDTCHMRFRQRYVFNMLFFACACMCAVCTQVPSCAVDGLVIFVSCMLCIACVCMCAVCTQVPSCVMDGLVKPTPDFELNLLMQDCVGKREPGVLCTHT